MEIEFYEKTNWSKFTLPKWEDGETEKEYLSRIGYDDHAFDLGATGNGDGAFIYTRNDDCQAVPRYLVCIGLNDDYTYIGVPDHFNLLLICKEFASLLQLQLLQSVFDALFQDQKGWFQYQRLDALKEFIKVD